MDLQRWSPQAHRQPVAFGKTRMKNLVKKEDHQLSKVVLFTDLLV